MVKYEVVSTKKVDMFLGAYTAWRPSGRYVSIGLNFGVGLPF